MTATRAQLEKVLSVGRVQANWKRSFFAVAAPGLSIPDPGHGLDQICPVVDAGATWDMTNSAHTSPFQPADLLDRTSGGSVIDGTGYIVLQLVPGGRPAQIFSYGGPNPERYEDMILRAGICVPNGRGTSLAYLYGGALSRMFAAYYAAAPMGEVELDYVRSIQAPPSVPTWVEGNNDLAGYRLDIPLRFHFREIAVAA